MPAPDQDPDLGLREYTQQLEQELVHRVGNSFQAVSALLRARAKAVADPEAKMELRELAGRVESFAAAHANLRFPRGRPVIKMKEPLESMVRGLCVQYSVDHATLDLRIEDFEMDPDRGLPLVLILHELCAHSFKNHAAPSISLAAKAGEQVATLCIHDLGFHLPKAVSPESGGSLGWDIIRLLVRQAGGTLLRPDGRPDAVEISVPRDRPG